MDSNTTTDVAPAPAPAPAPAHIIKNIQYRNILHNTSGGTSARATVSEETLDAFLTANIDAATTSKLPWNKLNKTTQLKKLVDFAENVAKQKNYGADEKQNLVDFFKKCLDNKRLQRIKDVKYDVETGTVIDIPILLYNKSTRHFTLKNTDKINTTIKSGGSSSAAAMATATATHTKTG